MILGNDVLTVRMKLRTSLLNSNHFIHATIKANIQCHFKGNAILHNQSEASHSRSLQTPNI